MYIKFWKPFVGLILFVLLVGMACNFGASDTQPTTQPQATEAPPTQAPAPTEPPAQTEAPAPTEAPAQPESGAVDNLQAVKSAIIQIESQGTFIDPEFGLVLNGAGRGSGFIIDPSGLAVTNNHVVTGAALLKVWVGGESESHNARVLGVSECSDLAVIDIDGDGYPYLDWYDGGIDVGMDMYIAGFPLGDPEYSLTKGVISKAKADGETSWASVDSVIEYDATSNPGNSGGPVVTPDGKILAVHYAGNAQTRQAFGISRDIAKGVIDQLKTGTNVDTIGVNGTAVSNEDGSLTGVWVSSVQSGSAADKAGVKAADIITMMENLVLATDGTLSQYCDILRSHKPGDTLGLEVLRWNSGELLQGQLNGRELEVVGVFGDNSNDNSGSSGSTSEGVVYNPNATEPGDIYYSTTFDGSLADDWIYFLTFGEEDDFSQEVSNGRFRTEITAQETYVYYMYEPLIFTDVQVEVTAENFGSNTNWVGVVCRYSEDGWYEVNILNTGEYGVFRYDPAKRNPYVALWTGGSTLIKTGKQINRYTVVCKGDKITVGINGQEVREVSMRGAGYGALTEGQVGLTVQATSVTPVIIELDDLKIGIPY
jgi:S1-C subfamily serine protease